MKRIALALLIGAAVPIAVMAQSAATPPEDPTANSTAANTTDSMSNATDSATNTTSAEATTNTTDSSASPTGKKKKPM
jgi:cytoskeletal protein RodZ